MEEVLTKNEIAEQPVVEVKKEKFSYSRMDTYKKCGYQYKIIYVDKKRPPFGNIATEFGSLMHKAEESIANCIKENKPIDYITIKNTFIIKLQKIRYKYPVEFFTPGKNGMTYYEKAYYYLEYAIYRLEKLMKENPSYELIGAEVDFDYDYDKLHRFQGSIDRVIRDNSTGNYLIYDIKSYDKLMSDEDLTTPLQMVVYTWAAAQLYNVSQAQISCHYDLPLMDIYQDGGTKGYMTRGIKKINSLFEGIENEDFEPKPSALCHWCAYCPTNASSTYEYKYLCPYFSTWEKTGDDVKNVIFSWNGKDQDNIVKELYVDYCLKNATKNV